jgi:hypothetical protein
MRASDCRLGVCKGIAVHARALVPARAVNRDSLMTEKNRNYLEDLELGKR